MALGIEYSREALAQALSVVNGVEKLRVIDLSKLGAELLDADEAELLQLAKDLQVLDLSNDELEAKIEGLALVGAPTLAFVLRILKLVFPKK